MPFYVGLTNWTDQGVRNVKDSPERAKKFVAMAEKMGCKIHHVFFTMGQHDIVVIFEAPNGPTATSAVLAVSSLGNVRTVTMPAYTADEMAAVVGKLP